MIQGKIYEKNLYFSNLLFCYFKNGSAGQPNYLRRFTNKILTQKNL